MMKCPFCAGEIQEESIKCRHCGEFRADHQKAGGKALPWHFRTSTIVISLCCVGPLALPLLWWRPRINVVTKLWITIAILLLSGVLLIATIKSIAVIRECYELIRDFQGRSGCTAQP